MEMAGSEFKVLESLEIDISKLRTLDDLCIFHVLKDTGLQTAQCVSVLSTLRAPSAKSSAESTEQLAGPTMHDSV